MGQAKHEMRYSSSNLRTPANLSPAPSDEHSDHSPIDQWHFLTRFEETDSEGAAEDSVSLVPCTAHSTAPQGADVAITIVHDGDEAWEEVTGSEYEVQSLSSDSSSSIATHRTNYPAVDESHQEPDRLTALRSLFRGLVVFEDQNAWYIPALRRTHLHRVAGKVFSSSKLLSLILDHLRRRTLMRLRLVSKSWNKVVEEIYEHRDGTWTQYGIWQDGSELRRPCRGICRWLKELYADRDSIMDEGPTDSPHQMCY